jgi:hypothetical protein
VSDGPVNTEIGILVKPPFPFDYIHYGTYDDAADKHEIDEYQNLPFA